MPNSGPTEETGAAGVGGPLQLMLGDTPVGVAPAEPPEPRGILRQLERGFLYLDRLIDAAVPSSLNPLQHTGAITVVTFLVATVSGIILLIWYRPSVTMAWESVSAMSTAPFTAGFLRSLHRYSSDAALMFGTIHAVRILLERRFGGARWLAWVTGCLSMGLLWSLGWSGYWLVWDLRAQLVAVGTAKYLDVLPIFGEPIGRSFLTDAGVNSLLFFVVFFFHMLVPLAMAVVVWIHITRLSRARFLTERPMSWWVMGTLLLLCVLYPATSAPPAQMTMVPDRLSMDWWYLMPLFLTERLSGGMLWAVSLGVGGVIISVPWWLAEKRREPAKVVPSRCNECTKCYQDCPFAAIEMIGRTDGNESYARQAHVNPSKCVSCGICAGSCDTAGIGLESFGSIEQRRRMEAWLKAAAEQGEAVHFGFLCAESAGAGLDVDPFTGICDELPGYRLLRVPCAGWVHPLLVERAVRHGAVGVIIVACGPGECLYREGAQWTMDRIAGVREPVLRTEKVEPERVTILGLDRTRKSELIARALALREGAAEVSADRSSSVVAVAATLLALFFAGLTGLVSDLGYASPALEGSELVVSFSHPGAVSENCRTLSEEELAQRPIHQRTAVECDRQRSHVRLRVEIDGQERVRKSITPSGIWEDGNSVLVERIRVDEGQHTIAIAIGETADPEEWTHAETKTLEFTGDARRVVTFDRLAGFGWH